VKSYTYISMVHYKPLISIPSLLRIDTVASDRNPLWPWATDLSLLSRRYSGSTVAMGRRRPSLLWSIVATSKVIFLHWKIFLKIQVARHITLCHVIFLQWKIILKIKENHSMSYHLSPLKNNYENSSSIPHHLMPCHLSLLKHNSKN
jgi:hypothetical protein